MTHTEMIKKGLNDWAAYFRRNLTDNIANMYLLRIAPFTAKPIQLLFDTVIQEREPKPSNFPSINYIRQFLGGLEEHFNVEYNPEGDQRFPIGKLWESFRILEKHGEDSFYNYCNSVKMPQDERQAVICKHKYNYNIKEFIAGGKAGTTFTEKHEGE